jgi:hypothetical protein
VVTDKDLNPGPITYSLVLAIPKVSLKLGFFAYVMGTDMLALKARHCEDSNSGCPLVQPGWSGKDVGYQHAWKR